MADTNGVTAVQAPAEATPDMLREIALRFAFDPQQEDLDMAAEAWRAALRAYGVKGPEPLSDDAIMEIAHRTATRYTHRSDPTESSYGFMRHTMLDFARKVLAAAGVMGTRQPPLPRDLDPSVPRSSGVAIAGVAVPVNEQPKEN